MAKRKSRRRTQLTFQRDTRSKGTDGFETSDWTLKGERFGSVEVFGGREGWAAQAVLGTQPLRIRIHYDSVIAECEPDRWRILNGTTVYEIESMSNLGLENKWLEFTCVTGSAVLS